MSMTKEPNDFSEPSEGLKQKRAIKRERRRQKKRFLEKKIQMGMELSDRQKGSLEELNDIVE